LTIQATEIYKSGITTTADQPAICLKTSDLMNLQKAAIRNTNTRMYQKPVPLVNYARENLPQAPGSFEASQFPVAPTSTKNYPKKNPSLLPNNTITRQPQRLSTGFTAATLSDVSLFPPDSMGAVGPTQYILAINGRIRSFNKTTGAADSVLNIDPDIFFTSVSGGIRTSDPRIRYDRLTDRWFITIITIGFPNNRLLVAVSDSGTISGGTTWDFFFTNAGGPDCFFDYATLGIDANALYVGGVTFCVNGEHVEIHSRVFVIRKSSIISGGPMVSTQFANLINMSTGAGPFCPQGVDNFYDSESTEGYFIGVDNRFFGSLILNRVSDPGGTPTISSEIQINVPATRFPINVRHLGNTRGRRGFLDAIEDRLMCAHIRDGSLWTTHHVGVNKNGVSKNVTRNGSRWYEIDISGTSPMLIQSGTLFHKTRRNRIAHQSYWMPSIMTSGQGHMAIGCSVAGRNHRADAVTAGRLRTTKSGVTLRARLLTSSSTSYNPPGNPGGIRGRRWGDYSYTALDPCDDMTMWTAQEFCNANNSWAVHVRKLLAPPPATPTQAVPSSIASEQASVNVTITGVKFNRGEFFDPGVGFDCRIDALVSGGVTVNSITYINPTTVSLNLSTVGSSLGSKNVTIINPDGQQRTGSSLLNVTSSSTLNDTLEHEPTTPHTPNFLQEIINS